MNRIYIGRNKEQTNKHQKTFFVKFDQANMILAALRSDHFVQIQIDIEKNSTNKDLKFLMHISRLSTQDGLIKLNGQSSNTAMKILENLGLHKSSFQENCATFTKKPLQLKQNGQHKQILAIGIKKLATNEQIDQDQLLKDQKINVEKAKYQSCADKPRACANCSCGRKDNEPLPSKQQLIKSINDGKVTTGCGKCSMADSFRCGSCPYRGLPAFKPGDKLQLMENGQIIVEEGGITVNQGKVKLEL